MHPLERGFLLDERWHWLRGELQRSKHPDLVLLGRLVDDAGCARAIIDDPAVWDAVSRAVATPPEDVTLSVHDLLHKKLRASRDAARRRSKRLQDFADVHALLEQDPALEAELSDDERALLAALKL